MAKLQELRISVFIKCAALITLASLTVAAVLSFQNSATINGLVKEEVRRTGHDIADRILEDNATWIRFGNGAAIEESVAAVVAESEGRLLSVAVLNNAGEVIVASGSENEELTVLGQQALEGLAIQSSADGFIIAHPEVAGETAAGAVVLHISPHVDLAAAVQSKLIAAGIAAGVMIVMVGLSALLLRAIVTTPMKRVNTVLEELSVGDFSREVPGTHLGDEIGSMARRVEDLRHKLAANQEAERERTAAQHQQASVVAELSEALSELANGNLAHQINTTFEGDYEPLRHNFNSTVETMVGIIEAVIENSGQINDSAGEISSASDDLSRRTENQAAALEETAASLDEITTAIRDAAGAAQRVEAIVSDAREAASKSDAVVGEAVNAMSTIEDSSHKISTIISVIDDIAFQTNLLALNAGVEAARAGEAGRGFAVVASEVRALAQRSSEAAKEIKDLITQSTSQVEQGVELVGRTGQELRQIIENVTAISEHIGGITASTADQSTSLSEVNAGVNQLDQVTQNNAAMVQEASAATNTLREQAESLVERVAVFRLPTHRGDRSAAG